MEKMTHDQAPGRGNDWSLNPLAREPVDVADASRAAERALGCYLFEHVISSLFSSFAPARLLLQTQARTDPSQAGEGGVRAAASRSSGPAVLVPAANTLHASRLPVSCARPRRRSADLPGNRRLCRNQQTPGLDCPQACMGNHDKCASRFELDSSSIDLAGTGQDRGEREREGDADLVGSPRSALPRKNLLREMVAAAPLCAGCGRTRAIRCSQSCSYPHARTDLAGCTG